MANEVHIVMELYDGLTEVAGVYDNRDAAKRHMIARKTDVWAQTRDMCEAPYFGTDETDDLMSQHHKGWSIWTLVEPVMSQPLEDVQTSFDF